ncbi:MAG: ATP-dependent helicase [Candidatus Woesearchaeota archaeon]
MLNNITYKKKPNQAEELDNILHPLVKKWFYSRFNTFSLPQLYGVMEIHSRQNILVSAPTGATKTLTGFLSILNELIDSHEKGILEDKVYCIYVSPLKALNNDIQKNLVEPLKEIEAIAVEEFGGVNANGNKKNLNIKINKLGVRVGVRTGDTTASEKQKMLKNPPHILITTPESLALMLASPKFRNHLMAVEWMIVDEIHALAENKRGVHLSLSMERLSYLSPHLTRIGLSATVAPLDEIAGFLVGSSDHINDSNYKNKANKTCNKFNETELRKCKIVDVQFIKELDLKVLCPVPDLVDVEYGLKHNAMYNLIDDLVQKHKSTIIFTNTRSATERVVDHLKEKFPKNYADNIGAHHGSLSAVHRRNIEKRLRNGDLKVCVTSTSLELGIDIGYIDLVICLGSPKSVARALQRIGRSGHKLHSITKGRIIVLDRDDLVECAVLLKSAIEQKIDRIHIPTNALDVLAQQIHGFAIEQNWNVDELYDVVRKSYCYKDLSRKDFNEVIDFLAGKFAELEDRYVYAKIWYNEETKEIGRKGRMSRVIYMTNIGTIPDESFITVKIGEAIVGKLDEGYMERLKRGDVFVLGGEQYEFLYARGMVAQVKAAYQRPPNIPSWFSEMLPLSFDLAAEIGRFRKLMEERFRKAKKELSEGSVGVDEFGGKTRKINKTKSDIKKEIISFINDYLYVDDNSANAIFEYFNDQFGYVQQIPHNKKILIEHYVDQYGKKIIFHSLFGRRVNDVLSRAIAYIISKTQHKDVEIGINDNGFYLSAEKTINPKTAIEMLRSDKIDLLMRAAIDKSEILKRRFRHCAGRSFMILRNYKGKTKRVGRQQVSSMLLINAVRRISEDFSILKEARREVLEDLMDLDNARKVIQEIEEGKIVIKEIDTKIPTPFAFNLALMGYVDVLKIDEKTEFLKRMHQMVKAKIGLGR